MAGCHDLSDADANPTPCLPALAPRLDNETASIIGASPAFTRGVVDMNCVCPVVYS